MRGSTAHPLAGLGSWHTNLSEEDAALVLEKGWGERHLMAGKQFKGIALPAGLIMIYAPRNEAEKEGVLRIIKSAYTHARQLNVTLQVRGVRVVLKPPPPSFPFLLIVLLLVV